MSQGKLSFYIHEAYKEGREKKWNQKDKYGKCNEEKVHGCLVKEARLAVTGFAGRDIWTDI